MNLFDAIRTRASVGRMRDDAVPSRGQIEQMLDAAIWAPNHRLTEPWRFVVIAGEKRRALGEVLAEIYRAATPDANEAALDRERAKPLRAPVLIAVTADAGRDEVATHENIAATAAGIQNMLLAAHALGLGAQWRTGDLSYHVLLNEYLGVAPEAKFMGLIYLGFPAQDLPPKDRKRIAASEKTEWRM